MYVICFLLCFFLQTSTVQVYHVPVSFVHYTKQDNKQNFRSNVPFTSPQLSVSYLPSVAASKTLTSQQIKNSLMREYGEDIQNHQEKILKLYPYYVSDNFISVVKQFPGYASFICATAKRIRKSFFFKARMKWHGVRDVFDKLENEIIKQDELKRKAAPSRHVMESQRYSLQELQKEYVFQPCQSRLLQQKRQQRLQSLSKYFAGNDACTEQTYILSVQSRQLLYQSGVTHVPQRLVCLGNGVQQNAYQECIDSINALANYKKTRKITNMDTFIFEMSSLGLQAASSGLVTQTYTITDFCWSAIDHLQAAGEGVCDGFVNVADMIAHPIDTVVGTGKGLYQVGHFLGTLLYEVGDIAVTGFYDANLANEKSSQFVNKICTTTNTIVDKLKNTPSRDYVRMGFCFITETILCGRALKASQKLYQASKTKALRYINNPSSKVIITTAEGIELEITAHASDVIFEKSGVQKFAKNKKNTCGARPFVLKVANMEEFFTQTSFGKKLFSCCEPIGKGKYRMTKKLKEYGLYKGDVFYLDMLHRDHLEIFSYRGEFATVLNLDGTVNYKKVARARRQARDIKGAIK